MSLPAEQPSAQPATPGAPAPGGPGAAGARVLIVRVLIVDDDPLVRAGLVMMLDGAAGIAVVGHAGDGAQALGAVDAHHPDVVLMDLRMPVMDGLTATRRLRARPHPPDVVVLTTFDTDDHVLAALRAGAGGFLLKDAPPARIVEAVLRVAAGEPILAPAVTRRLLERTTADAAVHARARAALAQLTPRERDVALGIGRGRTNAEIAADLHLSVATVKAHITRVLTRLTLTNRTQIALLVHDAGEL
ncbi:response regulator transcription factor [Frankia sp. AgB32]|uniref:response regulator transcription factor n=1 Tax=Frankia sp. AgB32 TaxID=631119 RepID=UPI00200BED6D|nr:response regulator transcription factor [Frankia sp. AgB32]MCK9896756.1 response regulator transcription factor [Frankia sp. AgB32]